MSKPGTEQMAWIAGIAIVAVLAATMLSKWYLRSITTGKAGGPTAIV